MDLVTRISHSDCPKCKAINSIVALDVYGRHYCYDKLFDSNGNIDNSIKPLEYFECKECGEKFMIDWSAIDRKPKPLISSFFYGNFLH